MIVVPEAFRQFRLGVSGEAARAWLDNLPMLVETLRARWDLAPDGAPMHGAVNLVVPVLRHDEPCVLRVCWREHGYRAEVDALRTWEGRGAVRLLATDDDAEAMLLERLDPSRTLAGLDLPAAAAIAGGLIRRLAVPAPSSTPGLDAVLAEIAGTLAGRNAALGMPVPDTWVRAAAGLAEAMTTEQGSRPAVLVHADLHYGNVLAGEREPWLAIDPRAVRGDPEYSVPELMWTRADDAPDAPDLRDLLTILVDAGELNAERARAYTVIRAVDYWLWGAAHGLTLDPLRCARLLDAFA